VGEAVEGSVGAADGMTAEGAVPKHLPARGTLRDSLDRWEHDGTLERIHHALCVQRRDRAGRDASPTAAIIDSQSVKSVEKGGPASTRLALMAAKKSKGRSVTSW